MDLPIFIFIFDRPYHLRLGTPLSRQVATAWPSIPRRSMAWPSIEMSPHSSLFRSCCSSRARSPASEQLDFFFSVAHLAASLQAVPLASVAYASRWSLQEFLSSRSRVSLSCPFQFCAWTQVLKHVNRRPPAETFTRPFLHALTLQSGCTSRILSCIMARLGLTRLMCER